MEDPCYFRDMINPAHSWLWDTWNFRTISTLIYLSHGVFCFPWPEQNASLISCSADTWPFVNPDRHIQTCRTGIWLRRRSVGATGDLVCCCRAKLLSLFPHVMLLQTLHLGIRPEYIHLSCDGIYIRMTNLFLSPDEGLGLHIKTQVKSGRQRYVARLHISSPLTPSLLLKTTKKILTCLNLSSIFRSC